MKTLLFAAALALLATPTLAQTKCYSTDEATTIMTKNGYDVGGVFPASDGILQGGDNDVIMWFNASIGLWMASEIVDGCVSTAGIPVPGWEPPTP